MVQDGQDRKDMYLVQDNGLKMWKHMSVRTPTQAWVCRDGVALSVILPMYEVLLYDDGSQNKEENWDRRRRTGGLTHESKRQDIWTVLRNR